MLCEIVDVFASTERAAGSFRFALFFAVKCLCDESFFSAIKAANGVGVKCAVSFLFFIRVVFSWTPITFISED